MDGLTALSLRCMHPIQQHGLRVPSFSLSRIWSMCSLRVSVLLTEIVQQIHSLRASGVISSQTASAFLSLRRASFISVGNVCAVPPGIVFSAMHLYYSTISGMPCTRCYTFCVSDPYLIYEKDTSHHWQGYPLAHPPHAGYRRDRHVW